MQNVIFIQWCWEREREVQDKQRNFSSSSISTLNLISHLHLFPFNNNLKFNLLENEKLIFLIFEKKNQIIFSLLKWRSNCWKYLMMKIMVNKMTIDDCKIIWHLIDYLINSFISFSLKNPLFFIQFLLIIND